MAVWRSETDLWTARVTTNISLTARPAYGHLRDSYAFGLGSAGVVHGAYSSSRHERSGVQSGLKVGGEASHVFRPLAAAAHFHPTLRRLGIL
jgi:hypothetical protein